MGDVAARIRIMPSSPEVDLEKIIAEVRKRVDASDIQITPIAFGLKAVDVMVVIPDGTEGGTSPVEEKLRQIEGVESVETIDVTLL